MDSMSAFALGMANRGKEKKVFDWVKAAKLIKARGAKNVSAGLREDLDWTSGNILVDGAPAEESGAYLSSTWATPVLIFDDDGSEIECFKMRSEVEDWGGAKSLWPESALEILNDIK